VVGGRGPAPVTGVGRGQRWARSACWSLRRRRRRLVPALGPFIPQHAWSLLRLSGVLAPASVRGRHAGLPLVFAGADAFPAYSVIPSRDLGLTDRSWRRYHGRSIRLARPQGPGKHDARSHQIVGDGLALCSLQRRRPPGGLNAPPVRSARLGGPSHRRWHGRLLGLDHGSRPRSGEEVRPQSARTRRLCLC
jgi:hypothetical protein